MNKNTKIEVRAGEILAVCKESAKLNFRGNIHAAEEVAARALSVLWQKGMVTPVEGSPMHELWTTPKLTQTNKNYIKTVVRNVGGDYLDTEARDYTRYRHARVERSGKVLTHDHDNMDEPDTLNFAATGKRPWDDERGSKIAQETRMPVGDLPRLISSLFPRVGDTVVEVVIERESPDPLDHLQLLITQLPDEQRAILVSVLAALKNSDSISTVVGMARAAGVPVQKLREIFAALNAALREYDE